MYKENPKTKGSGVITAIPQTGTCPNKCDDCFFQSGRSYLEPLDENLPNMPDTVYWHQVVRVNDGHDSSVKMDLVMESVEDIPMKFYNTAIPKYLDEFDAPVVLTINPAKLTDTGFHRVQEPPANLMMVRFRTNTWNLDLCDAAVEFYSDREVPIILTFMAYFGTADTIPDGHRDNYAFRKRTLNSYNAITTEAWENVMARYKYNKWVSSCGKIEGEKGVTACRFCGNCLREYHATMERLSNDFLL